MARKTVRMAKSRPHGKKPSAWQEKPSAWQKAVNHAATVLLPQSP
ncbi:MAG: hypothetical protein ACI3YI_00905 [Bacteroidaceae bacterium]